MAKREPFSAMDKEEKGHKVRADQILPTNKAYLHVSKEEFVRLERERKEKEAMVGEYRKSLSPKKEGKDEEKKAGRPKKIE